MLCSFIYRMSLFFLLFVCFNAACRETSSLGDLTWQNRLIVIYADNIDELSHVQNQIKSENLLERKLRLFIIVKGLAYQVTSHSIHRITALDNYFHSLDLRHSSAMLIGLDGQVKARYELSNIDIKIINKTIDLMPMRKAEISK